MMFFDSMFTNGQKLEKYKGRIPKRGDKVVLLDAAWDLLPSREVAKLAKRKYCTVESAHSLPIGENGSYKEVYEIYIKESGYLIGLYEICWKFYEE